MNYKTAIFRKIDSCFRRNDSGQKINSSFYGDEGEQKIDSSVIAGNEASLPLRKQGKQSRKTNLLFIILILFLITSFLASGASAQDIYMTNIWYKKLPNYTHLTVKATGEISEYEVSYLEEPDRIVIDVKNAIYSIDDLSKNILFLNMGSAKQVRCGQLENIPIPTSRFVVDLFQRADYEVKLSADKRLLYIDVYDYVEFRAPEEQLFTVTPVKSEAVKIEKEEAAKISLLDTYTEPINLKIFEEDVVNVIRGLSELTEIDIMIDDSVTGQLTLNLSNKTFREAIGLILMNKGLDFTEVSGTLVIAAKEIIAGYGKPITKIFELKNATAEGAKLILDGNKKEGSKIIIVADARMNNLIVTGTKGEIETIEGIISTIDVELLTRTFKIDNAIFEKDIEGIRNMLLIIIPEEERIVIDNRQKEIVIKGTKEELEKVKELIPKLDKRAQQMSIEIKFIEVDLIGEKELGIKWTSGGEEGAINIGELTLGGSFERKGLIEAKLLALQEDNKINILSNPKIHAINGKEALIFSGKKIPIKKKDPETGEYTMAGREPVGISMSIIPWITSDGLINMILRADKSYLGIESPPGSGLYIIESQQISYRDNVEGPPMIIRIFPDETVVLGGLIESKEGETIIKIPLLGDIPVIGELFKRTTKFKTKTQIIILITVHLLDY